MKKERILKIEGAGIIMEFSHIDQGKNVIYIWRKDILLFSVLKSRYTIKHEFSTDSTIYYELIKK